MPTLLILLLVLTIATCVIAYWADNLGKKLGKKRISLWNLRPRQTATLITVASSVGIMLLTMSALLGANKSVRNALTDYDRQKGESNRLKAELPLLQTNVKRTQSEAEQARNQANQAKVQADQAQTQAQQAQTQAQKAQDNLQKAQGALTTARSGEAAAKRGSEAAQRSAAAAQRQQAEAQRARDQANRAADDAKAQLNQTRSDLGQAKIQLASARIQLNASRQTQKQLKRGNAEFQRANAQFRKNQPVLLKEQNRLIAEGEVLRVKAQRLEAKAQRLEAQVRSGEDQVRTQEARVAQLNTKIQTLSAEAQQSAMETGLFSSQPISIEAGQVFTERTLPAGADAATVQAAALALIDEGQRVAKDELGAVNGMQLVAPPVEVNGVRAQLGREQILDSLRDYVSGSDVPVAIRLVAFRNHRADEKQIQARFITIPIRPAFARDETIASMTIDGSQPDARVFNQLLALVEAGRRTAGSRDVSPPLTPKNPNFTAAGTIDRLLEALRRVRTANHPVPVRLVADAPLSTAEQLRVRFDVG